MKYQNDIINSFWDSSVEGFPEKLKNKKETRFYEKK